VSIPVVTKKTVARSKAVLVFMGIHGVITVSYTHLTLPTSDLV